MFSIIASVKVKTTFSKYSKIILASGITGESAAKIVLDSKGAGSVPVVHVSGNLNDHFDPKSNSISLSDPVFGQTSAAAVGVAAHEAGHALQYAEGYFPLKIRNAVVPVTNIASKLSMPLVIAGLLLSSIGSFFLNIAYIGILFFSFSVLFQLVTLPTEFNASRRALKALSETGYFTSEELKCSKKVLSAAAMTYVAATAVAITQFIRLLALVSSQKGRRR